MRPQAHSSATIHLRQATAKATKLLKNTFCPRLVDFKHDNNCACRAAKMPEELSELLEVSFDYVTEIQREPSCSENESSSISNEFRANYIDVANSVTLFFISCMTLRSKPLGK